MIEAGAAIMVDDTYVIDDWVSIAPSPGHTPGHVCVQVISSGFEAVMSGDLMHHPVQCAEPDWNSCFCVDPVLSAATRRTFLETYAETPTMVLPAHFPSPSAGRIVRIGNTWRFQFDETE